ncbi:hypothetical protein A7U43_13295 [Mycobacterium adipatum]|jgi:hypothetical protein|uniref:PASTA domain-containing protein n=1 Tax=Mycobacterium adipatum TaxID=1682113 RepID=A0A172UMS5_9MYCO|nr:hypothetical protein [Mycobacterium adipatum]ANE80160.1 hypothetical protein A7U43_13295 [Mycobacterium adipatum]
MHKTRFVTAGLIALSATVLGTAPAAFAAPSGTASAAETVEDLRAQGYSVQVNGTRNGPLSNCSVESVRGLSDTPGSTVYVDLSCPAEYQY